MRARLVTALLATVTTAAGLAVAGPVAGAAQEGEQIDYHEWATATAFEQGSLDGVATGGGGLHITEPSGTADGYDHASWTSPEYTQGFDATELIASWNADTPAGTWLRVEVAARTASGERTGWYTMGDWAYGDGDVERTSVGSQDDKHASVSVDTLVAKDGVALSGYRLRVSLFRKAGGDATPTLRMAGAMTSDVPDRFDVPRSAPGEAAGTELSVPRYAQNLHKGHYPEYGGGGENWCSPTATEMVVEYWGKRPSERDLSWLPDDYVDPTVAHAARHTYDYAYEGTGNWPFNTAYAARYGLSGHVTRLHSLSELEGYIARGIPVITSQSFLESELDGAGYGTAGHLMVVVGFTPDGDVIANDPASDSNENVRNVYPRDQFERIWLRTQRHDENGELASGSGGVAYVITP